MTDSTDAFGLDWEALVGGTIALIKFLLGLYGVPDSGSQVAPTLSAHETVMIVRIAEPGSVDSTRRVLQNRLKALALPSDSIESLDSHLQIRTKLPETNEGLVDRLLAPGRVSVRHGSETILDDSNFERAELWKAEAGYDGQSGVKLILTDDGRRKWSEKTADLVGETCSMELDGEVLMTPKIMERITAGEIVITGFDIPRDLLLFYVNAGALPTVVELIELR